VNMTTLNDDLTAAGRGALLRAARLGD
jgi:hypothetical protein